MAHAVDEARAVSRLLPQQAAQVVPHRVVVRPVGHLGLDVSEHLHDLLVGAAVAGTLQGAHRRRDGGIDVGAGGGEHPAGKGGVVAAAVLGVEHQAQIQQPGLLVGVPVVVAHGVEEVLRHAQPLLGPVEVEGLVVVVVPLGREGVGHDHRYAGNELHRLPELVGQGHVIGPPVIGIEGQHRAGQLIHHIGAGGLEDHVLGEHGRQGPVGGEQSLEGGELGPGGQGAEEKQVGGLLKAEAALTDKAVDQLLHVDTTVHQLAGGGNPLAVLDVIAHDVADLGHPGHDAGAVGVAQAPLDAVALIKGRVDLVMLLVLRA